MLTAKGHIGSVKRIGPSGVKPNTTRRQTHLHFEQPPAGDRWQGELTVLGGVRDIAAHKTGHQPQRAQTGSQSGRARSCRPARRSQEPASSTARPVSAIRAPLSASPYRVRNGLVSRDVP